MRLLNTRTYESVEFIHNPRISYAILSHRWEDEEVSLAQMRNKEYKLDSGRYMRGWEKIMKFCDLVSKRDIEFAWVDTCCIDISSSAELQEAINSMYKWYQNAKVCIAYLSDVFEPVKLSPEDLGKSKWFRRGWTLQELIAPRKLDLYSASWTFLGTRKALSNSISSITRIPMLLLHSTDKFALSWFSVAQRMSWASRRMTTREEDRAYCLMGIFNVNMPLLYGEGIVNAFYRLQIEIIAQSEDESIFAWDSMFGSELRCRVLAPSPRAFDHCLTFQTNWKLEDISSTQKPYTMTNKGLHMWLILYPLSRANLKRIGPVFSAHLPEAEPNMWIAPLNCTEDGKVLAFLLSQESSKSAFYNRRGICSIKTDLDSGKLKEIFIRETNDSGLDDVGQMALNLNREILYHSRMFQMGAEGFQVLSMNLRLRNISGRRREVVFEDTNDLGSGQIAPKQRGDPKNISVQFITLEEGLRLLSLPPASVHAFTEQASSIEKLANP